MADWGKLGPDVVDAVFENIFMYVLMERGITDDIAELASKIGREIGDLLDGYELTGADLIMVWKLVTSGINDAIVRNAITERMSNDVAINIAYGVYEHKIQAVNRVNDLIQDGGGEE